MYVSSNYFSTIGVTLARGRGFTAADDASVAPAEAVISSHVWQLRFGSDPDIVGKTVTINQTEYTIVGVTSEGFRGHLGGLDGSYYLGLWLPLSRHPRLSGDDNVRLKRESGLARIVARLSPDTTLAQADAIVQSAMARWPRVIRRAVRTRSAASKRTSRPERGCARRSIVGRMILLGLAGMVLLVVGLNVSGMMLVRSAMRERELAIRLAMGASRWRLMQYHLSEALVLAVFGGSLASALLFGVPVDRGMVVQLLWPGARCVQAGCVAGPAVHRALLRDQLRAGTGCPHFGSAGRRFSRRSRTTPRAAAGAWAACNGSRRQCKPALRCRSW